MENKKPIIIAVIVLIVILTSGVLIVKLKNFKRAGEPPSFVAPLGESDNTSGKETILVQPTARNIFPVTGTVENIENNTLFLATDARGLALEITPDYTIFLEDGDKLLVSNLAELQKGSKVKIRYNGSKTPADKTFIPNGANQGVVTAIDDASMTLQMEAGEKVVDITAKPNIYLMEGETSVSKKASDLRIGSIVTIAYADEAARAVVVAVRIDQL